MMCAETIVDHTKGAKEQEINECGANNNTLFKAFLRRYLYALVLCSRSQTTHVASHGAIEDVLLLRNVAVDIGHSSETYSAV